jgi:hypothetical protein
MSDDPDAPHHPRSAAPGCDIDASRCEAHHITYWEHHGDTSVSTMVLLCAKHHHMVHEGRWRIERHTELDPGDPPGHPRRPDPSPLNAERNRARTGAFLARRAVAGDARGSLWAG